jgi:hypothetical protein
MYLGKRVYLNNVMDIADNYHETAEKNKKSADILFKNGLYNESAYFYIQAMEKYVKEQICRKIDVSNNYYAEKLRETGHSLDKSVDFLIQIYSGNNELIKNQIYNQIVINIFEKNKFEKLNNTLRYPFYNYHNKEYSFINMDYNSCIKLQNMTTALIKFMNDLYKLI